MKVGSLFSGIGGIEIGFEEAGFETEWFIESDPYAQTILRKRFHNPKIYGDIKKVNFTEVPGVEILTGGFPCQDISNAGKRAGIKGSRSSLWKYYKEAIRILRPKIAFIENVSAIINRGFDVVLADLASIGYDAEWYCIPASAVGANHRRDRIWITAYPQHSNANSFRLDRQNEQQQRKAEFRNEQERGSEGLCGDVSNTRNDRQMAQKPVQRSHSTLCEDVSNSLLRNVERHGRSKKNSTEKVPISYKNCGSRRNQKEQFKWSIEPELGRVANGIPNRVDRIKCIGNAVVPQVAEVFARAIQEQLTKM